MSNIYTSRFFLQDDEITDTCLLKIPTNWHNRKYEYKWAMNFVSKNDICLDSACGIPHPFKFYLASICDNVYAFDISKNIKNYDDILSSVYNFFDEEDFFKVTDYIYKINFSESNLNSLPYNDSFFSKIFCIGVINYLSDIDLICCLNEFYRVLKKGGYLIITTDVPPTQVSKLTRLIDDIGFNFVGNIDITKPKNTYSSPFPSCNNCFRALVSK